MYLLRWIVLAMVLLAGCSRAKTTLTVSNPVYTASVGVEWER